jgi:hypothetical protein
MPDRMATFLSKAQKGSHTIVSDGVPVAKPTKKTRQSGMDRKDLNFSAISNQTLLGWDWSLSFKTTM